MKKQIQILTYALCFMLPVLGFSTTDAVQEKKENTSNQKNLDPFNNDPFFQSQDEVFQQMNKMQQAMDKFIKSQFVQMQNNIISLPNQNHFANNQNIQIEEKNDEIVYKIKLAQAADSKVNVSVEDRVLLISTNVSQKITHERDNHSSISYTQSNYRQSFELPDGYDPKSMSTKTQDSTLMVTFKKKV